MKVYKISLWLYCMSALINTQIYILHLQINFKWTNMHICCCENSLPLLKNDIHVLNVEMAYEYKILWYFHFVLDQSTHILYQTQYTNLLNIRHLRV